MDRKFTNSIGMEFLPVSPGSFSMGQDDGDWDEKPVREVRITRPFFMARAPVTNKQFEAFMESHGQYRGIAGASEDDDAAVIFVTWHDAIAFCDWLSRKEGKPYRLPTEAEWEYACRAGTTSAYWTGVSLPPDHRIDNPDDWKGYKFESDAGDMLLVGRHPPNPWGFQDMHGLVEEWCSDCYGPYPGNKGDDPVGHAAGDFKVTRGGSYETLAWFLRSANRLAMVPDDRSRFIGFRVVQAPMLISKPFDPPAPQKFFKNVKQDVHRWDPPVDMSKPVFADPIPYVIKPEAGEGAAHVPFYPHNHCPAVTYCNNGDLIACWFSTISERGRELGILSSRLRRGAQVWEHASLFFKAADRNMTGSSLFNDGSRLLHFNGIEEAQTWTNLVLVLRESRDNGATWSHPRIISQELDGFMHHTRNQVIACTRKTRDGTLIQLCDAVPGSDGGTAVHVSKDGGKTWIDAGLEKPFPLFKAGTTGAWIAGIHAGTVELADGTLLAFGRGNAIDGKMPESVSRDLGVSWTYRASPFPKIDGGQRLVLMRLLEGPILFVSFTGTHDDIQKGKGVIKITDSREKSRDVQGMFTALSYDECKSWTSLRLVSDGKTRAFASADFIKEFTMDATHAEPAGYLCAVQSPDGIVHLLSSHLHYRFNLAWLKSPMV
nr:SUMF1/EgtB/PvdO family nonheme iron enzyme [Candidatus Sigynarchaeota archaeon]